MPIKEVRERINISQQQISKIKLNLEQYNSVVAPSIQRDRPRLLDEEIEKALVARSTAYFFSSSIVIRL